MSIDLVDILNLEELLDQILGYCSREDAFNVSLCSRQYNEALQPALWRSVTISCSYSNLKTISNDDIVPKLEHTEVLHFRAPKANSLWEKPYHGLPHPSRGSHRGLTLQGIEFMMSFEKIMTYCTPNVLRITDNFPNSDNIPLEYMGGVFDNEKLLSVSELIFEVKSTKFGISRMFGMICERLPHLRKLVVGYYPSRAYSALTHLPLLEELTLHMGAEVGDSMFDGYLDKCGLTDEGLVLISDLRSLWKLKLYGTHMVTDDGFTNLTKLKKLTHLYLLKAEAQGLGGATRGNGARGNAVPLISFISSLTLLDLTAYPGVTSESIESLTALSNLSRLNLSHTTTGDADATALIKIVTLNVLFISNADKITDAFALALSKAWCQLSVLEVLNMNSTGLSTRGLSHLRSLGSLKTIYCDKCPITEVAFFQAELQLELPRLTGMASFDAKHIPIGIYGSEADQALLNRWNDQL